MEKYKLIEAVRLIIYSPLIIFNALRSIGRQKVFCIGCNKTGTTSLETALKKLGFAMANQRIAELIAGEDWPKRDFRRIIRFCRSAQAFQDAPFSFPDTFKALDNAFPGSKFILTVRDTPEQWYESITRFHSKSWGDGINPLTQQELKQATYISKGRPWKMNRALYNSPPDDPYRKEDLIDYYNGHNQAVIDHFRDRPDDLLVLNVAEEGAYAKLCRFLEKEPTSDTFPWKNKTNT